MSTQNSQNWDNQTLKEKKKIASKSPFYIARQKEKLRNKIINSATYAGYYAELSNDKNKIIIRDQKGSKMIVPVRNNIGFRITNDTTGHKKRVEHREATYKTLVTNIAKILVKSQVDVKKQQRENEKDEQKTEELLKEEKKWREGEPLWKTKEKEEINNIHKNYAVSIPVSNSDSENDQKSVDSEFEDYDIS